MVYVTIVFGRVCLTLTSFKCKFSWLSLYIIRLIILVLKIWNDGRCTCFRYIFSYLDLIVIWCEHFCLVCFVWWKIYMSVWHRSSDLDLIFMVRLSLLNCFLYTIYKQSVNYIWCPVNFKLIGCESLRNLNTIYFYFF